MKKFIAFALLTVAIAQASSSFALFGRRGYNNNCCQQEQVCCQPVVETCCQEVVEQPCC
ncbi:hypothetical protein H0X48_02580 [Candidatus Dependentiae bacterium]|nr:hypothetical protein [Candidatus Dependentiae bacterium]